MATRTAAKPKLQIRHHGKNHSYALDGEPQKGRGVTTLLSAGLPAGGLVVWAARAVATETVDKRDVWEPILREAGRDAAWEFLSKAPDRDRDSAANRGSEVHNLAERLAAGETVEVPEELEGMVDAYLDWRATWDPTDELNEVVGANLTHRYFGRFDGLATFTGWWPDRPTEPARILYDIKTSRSGPFEKDALQLTAYRHFELCGIPDEKGRIFEPEPMPAVDGVAVLHLSADGYRFIPIAEHLDRPLFAAFLHVLRTAEFLGTGWKAEDRGWSKDVFCPPIDTPHQEAS